MSTIWVIQLVRSGSFTIVMLGSSFNSSALSFCPSVHGGRRVVNFPLLVCSFFFNSSAFFHGSDVVGIVEGMSAGSFTSPVMLSSELKVTLLSLCASANLMKSLYSMVSFSLLTTR